MRGLVAVDPGLDAAGVACFTLEGWTPRDTWREVLRRLTDWRVLRTSPRTPLCDRLNVLYCGLAEVVQEMPGTDEVLVLIEQPAMPGAYRERLRRQQGKGAINGAALAKLHMAVGALVAAGRNGAGRPQLVPSPHIKKDLRLQVVLAELRAQAHPLARLARPSPDLLDAVYLGAAWLTDPRRRVEAVQP